MRNVIRVVEFAKKSRPYKINFSQKQYLLPTFLNGERCRGVIHHVPHEQVFNL